MTAFARKIRPHVSSELDKAREAETNGSPQDAFAHLERAHVLGQASTREHVRVHVEMLLWGIRNRSPREILGQVVRIVGAATKTFIGLVPDGNTGGANISAFRKLPVPDDLRRAIDRARLAPHEHA